MEIETEETFPISIIADPIHIESTRWIGETRQKARLETLDAGYQDNIEKIIIDKISEILNVDILNIRDLWQN